VGLIGDNIGVKNRLMFWEVKSNNTGIIIPADLGGDNNTDGIRSCWFWRWLVIVLIKLGNADLEVKFNNMVVVTPAD